MKRMVTGLWLLMLATALGVSPLQASMRLCTVSMEACAIEVSEIDNCHGCETTTPCCLEIAIEIDAFVASSADIVVDAPYLGELPSVVTAPIAPLKSALLRDRLSPDPPPLRGCDRLSLYQRQLI